MNFTVLRPKVLESKQFLRFTSRWAGPLGMRQPGYKPMTAQQAHLFLTVFKDDHKLQSSHTSFQTMSKKKTPSFMLHIESSPTVSNTKAVSPHSLSDPSSITALALQNPLIISTPPTSQSDTLNRMLSHVLHLLHPCLTVTHHPDLLILFSPRTISQKTFPFIIYP